MQAYLGGRALKNPSIYTMPPSWIIKLTEGWGEPNNYFKGGDDGSPHSLSSASPKWQTLDKRLYTKQENLGNR